MREKELKAVVTFAATSDAMAMEETARVHGVPRRIIPVPSQIDAGCGLAWCVSLPERAQVETALERFGIAFEGVFEVPLY